MSSLKQLVNILAGCGAEVSSEGGSSTTFRIGLNENFCGTLTNPWNGAIVETASMTVTSDGATITFAVEGSGGGDLILIFSDGFFDFDTTPPAEISLTAGSDTSPQINYVYILQSTKVLTVSTVNWPTTEHAPLATVLCQSAASLQNDGAYKFHAWIDHLNQDNGQGHVSDINFWTRQRNSMWLSGVSPTLTITPNGASPDNVIFTSGSGRALQLHAHDFPAFSGTPDIYTVNDSVTPFNIVTDLNELLTDATGGTLSNRRFSLVIWGVVSETDSKLMVNLPTGSYGNNNAVRADDSKFANYIIPSDFVGTGFLIAQYNFRHQPSAGGSWTELEFFDLRGLFPRISAGSSIADGTEFTDDTFRLNSAADNTKEVAFDLSTVTTETVRTVTMPDRDINLSDTGLAWTEVISPLVAMTIGRGYIINNLLPTTLSLPVTMAVGDRIAVIGKGIGGYRIAQNIGQIINIVGASTTAGVGGSLTSTSQFDSLEILCITADTTFVVRNSVGTFTVV